MGRIGLVLGLLTSVLSLAVPMPAANANTTTFSFNLAANGSNATGAAWRTFKNSLTGSYGRFTFSGTNGSITVAHPTLVQTLAKTMSKLRHPSRSQSLRDYLD